VKASGAEPITPPGILYKYLHPDRTDVIENRRIRFTQPGAFNDPFEMDPHFGTALHGARADALVLDVFENKPFMIYDALPESFREQVSRQRFLDTLASDRGRRFLAMLKASDEIWDLAEATNADLASELADIFRLERDRQIGVLSLSERVDSLLMWAHYTQSHEGFVLAFDTAHPWFNRPRTPDDPAHLRQLLPVTYPRNRPSFPMEELFQRSWSTTKGDDWEYEREWRFIDLLSDAATRERPDDRWPIYLFSLPSDSICAVILGCRVSDETRGKLLGVLSKSRDFSHVRILQAVADKRRFRVTFTKDLTPSRSSGGGDS